MPQVRSRLEKTNLEAHVDLCAERYDRMADHIQQLDKRITSMETVLIEIRNDLQKIRYSESRRWNSAKDWLIGVLVTVSGFLIMEQFF
jgi:hypothetical protein|tara:strand:- start:2090 stop:2353 length:264 start_codon:yes stop_codon:yes gene_type:complete